jgi:hypothetical protein
MLKHGSKHSFTRQRKIPVGAHAGLGRSRAGHRRTIRSLFRRRRAEGQQDFQLCRAASPAHGHSGEMPTRALAGAQSFLGAPNPAGQNRNEVERRRIGRAAGNRENSPAEEKTLAAREAKAPRR